MTAERLLQFKASSRQQVFGNGAVSKHTAGHLEFRGSLSRLGPPQFEPGKFDNIVSTTKYSVPK